MTTPGYACLAVSTDLLKQLLALPEDCEIINARPSGKGYLDFIVASPALPVSEETTPLPRMTLTLHQETLPEHPEFKRITAEVKLL